MQLHCLRHGLTERNLERRFNGTREDALTAEQVRTLRQTRFDASGYDIVYCSPLARAVQTADCLGISERVLDPRISERNFGVFEGLTPEECTERYPEAFAQFLQFDADFTPPEGENRSENLARVMSWLEDAARFERVLAITHGGTIDFLYRLGSRLPPHGGGRIFASENATLSIFEIDWPEVTLRGYSLSLSE